MQFSDCYGVQAVAIPDTVYYIGENAFSNCQNLTAILFGSTVEQWNSIFKCSDWSYNVPAATVICSDGSVPLY